MADDFDLDDEELELIRKRRAARKAEDFSVRIRDDKGNEAELPYGKGRSWLQRVFGIDLDEQPEADEEPEAKPKRGKDGSGEVRRFSGRRVS